jgi:hypothetical protein
MLLGGMMGIVTMFIFAIIHKFIKHSSAVPLYKCDGDLAPLFIPLSFIKISCQEGGWLIWRGVQTGLLLFLVALVACI